jgi:dienelactone hydrolase
LKAAFVFYGSAPEAKEELVRIKAPVYGFYGGNDNRINATLPKTIELMKELGKKFDPVTYDGAGHAFMRAGDAPEPKAPAATGDKDADAKATNDFQTVTLVQYKANKKARDDSWVRWKGLLGGI